MSKHTPGPWIQKGHEIIWDTDYGGPFKLLAECSRDDNAARIVACVNACEGISDPSVVPELLAALKLSQRLMANLMGKGNVNWGNTFGIDFGLMNEALIAQDRAIARAEGKS